MFTKHKLLLLALVAVSLVAAMALEASAFCSTCGVPVAAYRPVYTTAYAPVVYTTYRPYTGWYPGYWVDRVRTRLWGAPVAYTASYYPVSYSAGYASYATSYGPACSSCVSGCTTCGYASYYAAPACSTCSTCTAYYAPDCPSCVGTGCSDCGVATTTVTQAVYQQPAVGCANCAAQPAAAVGTFAPAPTPTPTPMPTATDATPTPAQTSTPSGGPPALGPTENPPAERQFEAEKPEATNSGTPLQPEPAADDSGESANIQAPQLFDPSDRTAEHHQAPVWTAVYHKPVDGTTGKVYTVSRREAEADAAGWTSASE